MDIHPIKADLWEKLPFNIKNITLSSWKHPKKSGQISHTLIEYEACKDHRIWCKIIEVPYVAFSKGIQLLPAPFGILIDESVDTLAIEVAFSYYVSKGFRFSNMNLFRGNAPYPVASHK